MSGRRRTSLILRALGFEVGRLKTGTPPRLDGRTIDYTKCVLAPGGRAAGSHEPLSRQVLPQRQLPCWLTRTTEKSHEAIRKTSTVPPSTRAGSRARPRYCPSIEDKVVKFPHHDNHQVFIEPKGTTPTRCM
jgi:tRNA uridine 5-carboxymethylaminomethyl modification enzyme